MFVNCLTDIIAVRYSILTTKLANNQQSFSLFLNLIRMNDRVFSPHDFRQPINIHYYFTHSAPSHIFAARDILNISSIKSLIKPFQAWIYHCHLHQLQAVAILDL